LLGGLVARGVSPDLVVLSDGAPQFVVFVHAACWIHAERPLARLVPHHDEHRAAIEKVRTQIWELYQDLKAYQRQPDAAHKPTLESRFDVLCGQKTGYPSIDGVLKEMREHKADLLCVLERPEVPLHNNGEESDIRDYVKKRAQYEKAGVREYWIIDPEQRRVQFLRRHRGKFREVAPVANFFESAVLPGFRLDVRWLWSGRRPAVSQTVRAMIERRGELNR
jgi:hypothetical protein